MAPSQEYLVTPNKKLEVASKGCGPPTVNALSRMDKTSKGFSFDKINSGWAAVMKINNKSPIFKTTFNFHNPQKQANINRVELELKQNFCYPPNQNSDMASTRGFERKAKKFCRRIKQPSRHSFGQPEFHSLTTRP